jgi:hypothetical protein
MASETSSVSMATCRDNGAGLARRRVASSQSHRNIGLNAMNRSNCPKGRLDMSRFTQQSIWNPRASKWRIATPLTPGTWRFS